MYAASDHIRHADVEGCRIILDLETNQYRALDPIASAMWAALTGEVSEPEMVTQLGRSRDVAVERIRHDQQGFAATCLAERLLQKADSPAASSRRSPCRPRRIGWLRALRTLVLTNRALADPEGFAPLYRSCMALYVGPGLRMPGNALSTFVRAENLYSARRAPDDCLGRSLALYRFLCHSGVRCRHLIGVGRIPFKAHAWVEYDGEPLLDRRGLALTPIAVLTAYD